MQESSRHETGPGFTEVSQFDRADQVCDAYERAWLDGSRPRLEDFLVNASPAERDRLRQELVVIQRDYT